MKWIGPLFINAGNWAAYVCYENGTWYIDKKRPTKIGEGNSGTILLPIFEKSYGESYEHQINLIKNGLKSVGIDENIAYGFPFHVPVIEAFKYKMRFSEMTSEWLPHIELNTERAQLLFNASQDKFFSQKIRHRILKVVNSWTKEHGYVLIRN